MERDPLAVLEAPTDDVPILLVAAHPDDEVIGAGSRIPMLSRLTVVHVTDGSPRNLYDAKRHGFHTREAYAAARREEYVHAMRAAGADPDTIDLGIADQEATECIGQIMHALARIITSARPEFVMTHPYEGGHPDHDACAVAVHLAAGDLPIVEFTSYHRSGESIRTGEFLLPAGSVLTVELDDRQRADKRRMLDCFHTQAETLAPFGVERERFRIAPSYDFTSPPQPGSLYYEQFDWGMTGERFRSLAREVLARC